MSQGIANKVKVLLDPDGTFAANDDLRVPTQKATKTFADTTLSLTDATLPFTDNTTNNVSSTKHGWAPKMPAREEYGLAGDGTPRIINPFAFRRATHHFQFANGNTSGTTSMSGRGFTTYSTGSTGSPSVQVSATTLKTVPYVTTTNIGNAQGFAEATTPQFAYNRRTEAVFYYSGAETVNVRHLIGFHNTTFALISQTDLGTATYAHAMFRSTRALGGVVAPQDVNWQACVGDGLGGGGSEVIDTGVVRSTTTMQRLAIKWDGTGTGKVRFYIDGTLVATSTIDLPATTGLFTHWGITVLGNGAARSMLMGGVQIKQEHSQY